MQCLLCGWRDAQLGETGFPSCKLCAEQAASLSAEEDEALQKLAKIPEAFQVWSYGRREDSEERGQVTKNVTPVPQPARLFPGLRLYLGDLDDAKDVKNLKKLGIGCVINLCADKIAHSRDYKDVPNELAAEGIHQLVLIAEDSRHFNILEVAPLAFSLINYTLAKETKNGVLIHCWGGVNRSAAVAVAFLVTQYKVPLYAAVAESMKQRGCILTNQSFCAQLVRSCFKQGLSLTGEEVPAELLQVLADPVAEPVADPSVCQPEKRHRKDPPRDTADHGLRFAVRDGCLQCVTYYMEQGVDPEIKGKKHSALEWAEWHVKKAHGEEQKKTCRAILDCLKRRHEEETPDCINQRD